MPIGQMFPLKMRPDKNAETNGTNMKKHKWTSAIFICFSLITFLLAGFVGFLAVTHTKGYAVQSDSMAPVFGRGDVVFIRCVKAEDLRAGDIVTIRSTDGSMAFTHRITRIDKGKSLVYTKGDNNPGEDTMPADMSLIAGRVWFSLPFLGNISAAVQSRTFLILLAATAILFAVVRLILTAVYKHKKGGGKDAA